MSPKSNRNTSTRKDSSRAKRPDDFKSVAKRLSCDPDLAAFDAKLKKIAKAKVAKK